MCTLVSPTAVKKTCPSPPNGLSGYFPVTYLPTRGNPASDSFTEPNLGPLTQHAAYWHWVRKNAAFIARRHKARMGSSISKPHVWGRGSWGAWGAWGQLMCSSLIGWWWVNTVMFLESQPSALWFHLLQGLCACRQHAVNFFHLVGVLVSAQQLKNVAQNIICSPWGGTEGPWLCFMAKLILFHLVWLFPFGFVFLWIKFALWNLGKAWEAKAFLQTIGKVHEGWGVLSPASPHRVLLSRSLPPEIGVACGCFRAKLRARTPEHSVFHAAECHCRGVSWSSVNVVVSECSVVYLCPGCLCTLLVMDAWVASQSGLMTNDATHILYKSFSRCLFLSLGGKHLGSQDTSVFNFIRDCQTVVQTTVPSCTPASHLWAFQWLHFSATFGNISLISAIQMGVENILL